VPGTASAGGPNPVSLDDPPVAQCLARVPRGPIHELLDDERAEHVRGCNIAFARERLLEIPVELHAQSRVPTWQQVAVLPLELHWDAGVGTREVQVQAGGR
jgi:hypothetical protein